MRRTAPALLILLALALLLPLTVISCEEDEAGGAAKPAADSAPGAPPKADEEGAQTADAKATPRATNDAVAPVPVPAGMVYLEAGRISMGTEKQYLLDALSGRPPEHVRDFLYESPPHHRFQVPYFIGRYEVTNAQYQRFLEDACATVHDTSSGSLPNLEEISAFLIDLPRDERLDPQQVVWRQCYNANKKAIWEAFAEQLDDMLVKGPDGKVDEHRTALAFRRAPLPRNLKLSFYTRRPPTNWPDIRPPEGEEDHPVRFFSYNDAERFCEWAGVHVATEAEWEWAARGPDAPTFPWGNDWPATALYANWGGKITNKHFEPTTLPVATRDGSNPEGKAGRDVPIDGDGRSWCGCHHMTGNVAEWTGSWFERYPGNDAPRHRLLLEGNGSPYVKVIRGGGAGDSESLVLRAACRNFVGTGQPPYPENFYRWVGFRIAAHLKPGRDRLEPVVRRAVANKKVKEPHLALGEFAGAMTRNWVEPESSPENHVYVLGRSSAILIIPLTSFIRDEGLDFMTQAHKRPGPFKTTRGLLKKTEEDEDPTWIAGVLHTDIALDPVDVLEPPDPKEAKKRPARGRGKPKAPKTRKGVCPPGTYLLALWFGRLAILTPSTEFVAFLPREDKKKTPFEVEKRKAEDALPAAISVDPSLDWATFAFDMPLGGNGVSDDVRLAIRGRLQFEVGQLEQAGRWYSEDPAADLVARLRAAHEEAEAAAAKERRRRGK